MGVVCNTGINLLDVVVYEMDTQGAASTQDNEETRGGWAACHPKDA